MVDLEGNTVTVAMSLVYDSLCGDVGLSDSLAFQSKRESNAEARIADVRAQLLRFVARFYSICFTSRPIISHTTTECCLLPIHSMIEPGFILCLPANVALLC